MSRSLILVCEQCNKSLWAGQGRYIYTQPESQMKAFNEFMCDHFGHPLRLVDHNWDSLLDKCEDVTPEEAKEPVDPEPFVYASWIQMCTCGKNYGDHPLAGPLFQRHQFLRRICNGKLVKL